MSTNYSAIEGVRKTFFSGVAVLASGASVVVDARGTGLVVITAGGTAVVSRVDAPDASADTGGTQNDDSVSANTRAEFRDWPYYRITATGGDLRYYLG